MMTLAFVLGSAISVKLTSDYYEKLFDKFEFYNPAFNIIETVKTLQMLRKKELQDAIHYEEWRLDDNIVNLSNSLKRSQTEDQELMKFVLYSLNMAADYREKNPFSKYQSLNTKTAVNALLFYAKQYTKQTTPGKPIKNNP